MFLCCGIENTQDKVLQSQVSIKRTQNYESVLTPLQNNASQLKQNQPDQQDQYPQKSISQDKSTALSLNKHTRENVWINSWNLRKSQKKSQSKIEQKVYLDLYLFSSRTTSTDIKSLRNDSGLSVTDALRVLCKHCEQWVGRNFISLACQHFYCVKCLYEELLQQSHSSLCTNFQCRCSAKISAKTILQIQEYQRNPFLLENIKKNQIKQLQLIVQKSMTVLNCPNKYCQFFCIFQAHLESEQFYCPLCLIFYPV